MTKVDLEILQSDALAGDSDAQLELGKYHSSYGRYKESFVWFEKSALQGNVDGQFNLALCYENGRGVAKDVEKAIGWYVKSASQGNGLAAWNLGRLSESGYKDKYLNKVQADPDNAFYWYRIGYEMPKYRHFTGNDLARCYELGIGTPKCPYRAYELYKKHKANEKISHLLKSYNPLLDSRLSGLDVLGNNPFRILGVYSNASEREIRANKSKLDSMVKVGQSPNFKTDHLLPCNITDYTGVCQERINYANTLLSTKGSSQNTSQANELLDRAIKELSEWASIKENNPEWQVSVSRTTETVSDSFQKIASDTQRIKYGLFWFNDYTDDDKKALRLLSEHKWDEARCIWDSCSNFSAHINRSVLSWFERDDYSAILEILSLFYSDEERTEFISAITSGRAMVSREDLSLLFWNTLFSFPQNEMSWYDFRSIITQTKESPIGLFLNQHEEERERIKKLLFDEIKSPLENMLSVAEAQDPNNWGECVKEYGRVYNSTYKVLATIERFVGKDYFGYILFCNKLSEKLLHFSIHYNNDNKEAWDAAHTALMYARVAFNIAKDEVLRERCKRNVEIFENNNRIAQTEKSCEYIDEQFGKLKGDNITIAQVESIYSSIEVALSCIESNAGKNSVVYKNESNRIVNKLLNIVISVYNNNKNAGTASSAEKILCKMQNMTVTQETKIRLDNNIEILKNNFNAALKSGDFDYLISGFESSNTLKDNNPPKASKPKNRPNHLKKSHSTCSVKDNKKRIILKGIVTIISILMTTFTYWCISNGNPERWFVITCIVIMSILVLFLIVMWLLELRKDPLDSDIEWFFNVYEKIEDFANQIEAVGVQGRKTYSWPFALPFHLLAMGITLIGFIVNGLARIAVLIK